jgi:hypothetical protein
LKGFGEDGKAIRTLTILKVNKGQIEKIVPWLVRAFEVWG